MFYKKCKCFIDFKSFKIQTKCSFTDIVYKRDMNVVTSKTKCLISRMRQESVLTSILEGLSHENTLLKNAERKRLSTFDRLQFTSIELLLMHPKICIF